MYFLNIISAIIFVYTIVLIIDFFNISSIVSLYRKYLAILPAAFFSSIHTYGLIHSNNNLAFIAIILLFPSCFFILYGKIKISYIYIALTADITETLLYTSISSIFHFQNNEIIKSSVILFTRILILLSMLLIKKKRKPSMFYKGISVIPKYIYLLIVLDMFSFSSLFYVINYPGSSSAKKQQIINILISFSIVLTTAIILSLLVNVLISKHSEYVVNLLKSQMELQISHYEKMDKLNSDIRRFRHDYINHLHSVLSLIKMSELNDAQKYIEKLLKIEDTPTITYNTGNHLADAILSDKSEKFGEGKHIDFSGIISPDIDNVDLCTILSNALDNAIESCHNCAGERIDISSNTSHGYLVITITNPTNNEDCLDCIPASTKVDSVNHGLGLLSIELIANKYDGKIDICCKNGVFKLSVLLKII